MALVVSDFKAGSVDFKKNFRFNLDYFKRNFDFKDINDMKMGDVVLSSDHSNSYFLLKKFNVEGLVVVDQHIDIYNIKGLNKANVFRRCFEEKLIKFIVFVGIRDSEVEEFKFEKNLYDIEIIRCNRFNDCILRGLKILKDKGFRNIAIDIDLDAFDSSIIKGVEYSKKNLKNVLGEREDYIKRQLDEEGLDVNVDIKKIKKYAIENDLNVIYWHITEFEPELDDGKTIALIKKLI